MKILFICGSLEPGSDGVGDYARRLALEIIKCGHDAALLSIHDQFINKISENTETLENLQIKILRIPYMLSIKNNIEAANSWINNYNPDWLSLQYVPFSFNDKGIPFGLSNYLSNFTQKRYWHIMFHELWVGMEEKSSLKYKLWGYIQKKTIKQLLVKLKPALIHTQTKLYQIQLSNLGYDAKYLPLFSNIPVIENKAIKPKNIHDKKIIFVVFGTIHPGVPIENFAQEAAMYKHKTTNEIELILIGRTGVQKEIWIKIWESKGLKVNSLGEQTTTKISELFSSATFGISSTALPLIEKSGSVAAMLEHKLPVICISNNWRPTGIQTPPTAKGIIEYKAGNFEYCITKETPIIYTKIKTVSKQLLDSFASFK